MRRTVLLIALGWGWMLAGLAQDGEIIVKEQFRNSSLATAMEQLEERYHIQISYDNDYLSQVTVNQTINGLPLEEALQQLLAPAGLAFQVLPGGEVLIRPRGENEGRNRQFVLKGQVADALSGEPLPYAAVLLESPFTGAETDEYGRFELPLPEPGESLTLRVQYVGYHPYSTLLTSEQSRQYQKLQLAPHIQEIEPVTVSERPPVLSTRKDAQSLTLDAGQLARLPAFLGGNDLFRQMQLLPGISAHDDLSADLNIRGGDGDENMILLDGITLYSISHFFGVFSSINPEMIDEVKLYKNAFPAEYGGRTSGVVEMASRQPAGVGLQGSAELNLLLANAYLAVPLGKKMGLALSGRITGQDVADTRLYGLIRNEEPLSARSLSNGTGTGNQVSSILTAEPDFNFYDTYARWQWRPSPGSQWAASFFHSKDVFHYQYEQAYSRRFRNNIITTLESYNEQANWANTGFSLQGSQQWSPGFQSALRLSYSSFQTDGSTATSITRPVQNDSLVLLANGQSNHVQGMEFNWKNEWVLSEKESLSGGYNFLRNEVEVNLEVEKATLLDSRQAAGQHALFLEHQKKWDNRWSSTLGLRATYYQPDKTVYLSPRLQLNYQLNEDWRFKGALSRYNQFLREMDYEDRFGRSFEFWVLADDTEFPIAHANQAMLGFNWRKEGFELDVECYAKQTEGQVAYALLAPGFATGGITPSREFDYRLFRGQGQSRGIDILLKKDWGPYSGWLAYTLSKTTQRYREINRNEPFPSQDDRRHQLKWANMVKLGRWEFSATYIFASGRPFTDLARFQRQDRREAAIEDFITYLPDYHRADVEAGYNFHLSGLRARAGVSVFNLFDHDNIKYRQYIYSLSAGETGPMIPQNIVLGNEVKLLGRTLNLSFGIRF
ncbi:MAG: TonB-dependent receptor [Lewinellaceae bacterium]|nr:TonB-dependent receptor [Lewinellaceae bacterium]